jgi:hypothetical protein
MNYEKNYYDIINNALKRKNIDLFEEHHILPKSLFPKCKNCLFNLVKLTLREHYLVHYILYKKDHTPEMIAALKMMSDFKRYNRFISAREYEKLRAEYYLFNPSNKKIFCFETNEVYSSMTDASKCLNVSIAKISTVCHKNRLTTGGYHFCFEEEKDIFEAKDRKKNYNKVYCLELDKVFESALIASKELDISDGKIRQCCSKGRHEIKGFHFFWFEEEKTKESYFKEITSYVGSKRKIINLDTKQVFNSLSEAAISINQKGTANISSCCRKIRETAGGYHWEYLEEKNMTRKVICLETLKIYNSLKEAAIDMKADPSAIGKICKGKGKKANGYHFEYFDELKDYKENIYFGKEPERTGNNIKILCEENNRIYGSIAEAARELKLKEGSISRTCRGINKSSGGYHFSYFKGEEVGKRKDS